MEWDTINLNSFELLKILKKKQYTPDEEYIFTTE